MCVIPDTDQMKDSDLLLLSRLTVRPTVFQSSSPWNCSSVDQTRKLPAGMSECLILGRDVDGEFCVVWE